MQSHYWTNVYRRNRQKLMPRLKVTMLIACDDCNNYCNHNWYNFDHLCRTLNDTVLCKFQQCSFDLQCRQSCILRGCVSGAYCSSLPFLEDVCGPTFGNCTSGYDCKLENRTIPEGAPQGICVPINATNS